MPPLMRAPAAGRLAPVPGSSLVSGSGSGSLPGLVLFESGFTGMGYAKHTRSAIRIRTLPVGQPTVATIGSNHCNGSDRTVATFRWVRTVGPSWSAINSAPVSHSKHTKNDNLLSLSLSSELEVSYCVLNWEVEF